MTFPVVRNSFQNQQGNVQNILKQMEEQVLWSEYRKACCNPLLSCARHSQVGSWRVSRLMPRVPTGAWSKTPERL